MNDKLKNCRVIRQVVVIRSICLAHILQRDILHPWFLDEGARIWQNIFVVASTNEGVRNTWSSETIAGDIS